MCSLCLKSLCMMRISIFTFVSCVFITVFCYPTKHLRIFFNFECPTKHLLISCNHPSCELHSLCVSLNLQIDLNGTNQCICVVSSWLIQLLTFYCQFLTCYVSIATKEPLVILMIPNDRLTGPVWRDIFSEGQIKTDIVSEAVTRCILPSLSTGSLSHCDIILTFFLPTFACSLTTSVFHFHRMLSKMMLYWINTYIRCKQLAFWVMAYKNPQMIIIRNNINKKFKK